MAQVKDIYGYKVIEDKFNGWYRLSVVTKCMGEVYNNSKLYRDKPTEDDYKKFIEWANKKFVEWLIKSE